MGMYAGDEDNDDDVTSGLYYDDDDDDDTSVLSRPYQPTVAELEGIVVDVTSGLYYDEIDPTCGANGIVVEWAESHINPEEDE